MGWEMGGSRNIEEERWRQEKLREAENRRKQERIAKKLEEERLSKIADSQVEKIGPSGPVEMPDSSPVYDGPTETDGELSGDPLNSLATKTAQRQNNMVSHSSHPSGAKLCGAPRAEDGRPCENLVVKNNRCHWHS